jgi:Trk K+ transport system NAD-binding subunit
MKTFAALVSALADPFRRWNVRLVLWMVVGIVILIAVFSIAFHLLMAAEGRAYSWATGIYWTLTVMSTLGFGDITFESDIGRLFSVVVLLTGIVAILAVLPFAFIQFIFVPWMNQRESARTPRKLDEDVHDHIVLTRMDAVTDALIRRARRAKVDYVVIVADVKEGLRLHDSGYDVMLGELDDPETYERARVDHAALIAATQADTTNTNIAFTIREFNETVPIVATANSTASVDILQLAGCNEVLHLGQMLGRALARRIIGIDAHSHVVGEFGNLRIAEAGVSGTALVGQTLRESRLRQRCNVSVVGMWEQGKFALADPDAVITDRTVLILAGSDAQLKGYDRAFGGQRDFDRPVLILGGGRVGRAAGEALKNIGVPFRIVEKRPERIRHVDDYVQGDAAELDVLHRAGLKEAAAVLVTTHEDDMNVYLTLYCRKLRPDVQIISRATLDRNISTLHRAGADAVLSYASLGATAIWNASGKHRTVVLAEGLEVFRLPMPRSMAGHSLMQCAVSRETGCHVVATARNGDMETNPDPSKPLPGDADLVVIGDEDSEQRFLERFWSADDDHRSRNNAKVPTPHA